MGPQQSEIPNTFFLRSPECQGWEPSRARTLTPPFSLASCNLLSSPSLPLPPCSAAWRACKTEPSALKLPKVEQSLKEYQDPTQVDKLLKVDQQLSQTKEILLQTIDKVLQRGEKLEDLVDKSKSLTDTSKQFFKAAKKTNSCCIVM